MLQQKYLLPFGALLGTEGIYVRLANVTQDLRVTRDLAEQQLEVKQDILGSTDGTSWLFR